MMIRPQAILRILALLALTCWAIACGDGATEPPAPPPDPPRATTLTVTPAAATLTALGQTEQLTARVLDQNGQVMAGAAVTWASGNASVATVDGSGLVTAVANGTATITATSGSASESATVTVSQVVTDVAISPAADTLVASGDTVRLAAEATDANGHAVAGAEFAWSSGDTAVATVDAEGLVTGVAAGEAEITATSSGMSGSAALTVVDPAPSFVAVTPDTVALTALGQTARLSAEVRDQAGRPMEGVPVSWSSADTAVATVDSVGLVTAVRGGTTTVEAAAGEVSGEAVVTVMQSAGSVVVMPAADTIARGDTLRLAAEAFDENGNAVEGAEFAWSSSDAAAATVTGSGLVRGVSEGTATITAVAGEARGTAEITVEHPDRAALVALYNATNGPKWANSENWLTDAPLGDWYGVRTDGEGRVVSLDLVDNGLAGEIPPKLGGMSSLDFLNLGGNDLSGPIPPELGNTSLGWMSLNGNDLSGPIPPELGGLANLGALYLRGNDLAGEIPPELGSLSRMTWLDLGVNDLTGPIPPEFGNLVNLKWLLLDGNRLESGVIPRSLLQLTRLLKLSLPDGLCVPGTTAFVAWLRGMENRDDLDESLCNAADVAVLKRLYEVAGGADWTESAGWAPGDRAVEEWHGVSADTLGWVTALDLGGNGLSGQLPASLGRLVRMTELRVADNSNLSGRLPLSLAGLSLRTLHYSGTGVCAPADRYFRDWLSTIPWHEGTGDECAPLTDREILEVLYNATGGPDWLHNDNWLTDAPLGEWHGIEVDEQGRVVKLELGGSDLTGRIPVELGSLTHLESLDFYGNNLEGPIPAALANLSNLTGLLLGSNDYLTGAIPAELGKLANLEWLFLDNNNLSGLIPAELGSLVKLRGLSLAENRLSGLIPAELTNLADLRFLIVHQNELAGPIPPELGNLSRLERLSLHLNGLTGSLPAELGLLGALRELHVGHNRLHGTVPLEFQGLANLRELTLAGNADMSGALPVGLAALESLKTLSAGGTGLCAPPDDAFIEWLVRFPNARVARCGVGDMPAAAYLVQAVQSREFPVPLVAGREALLRVFVTASRDNGEPLPAVRATFHRDGALVHMVEIPAGGGPIPTEVDEGSLAVAANAVIPADVIRPGLEMTIEIDPDGTLDSALGVARRIPEEGRLTVDVRETPVFRLTVIPFLWSENPDSAILELTAGMAADPYGHELLTEARTLLPVGDLDVTAHEPVSIAVNHVFHMFRETRMIRALEGGGGYWMGMITGEVGGIFGAGPDLISTMGPNRLGIAHELGHNMTLPHTPDPCGGASGPDPAYPYSDGSIGAWGYDFDSGGLVRPSTYDVMGYCGTWISDYNFAKALRFRLDGEAAYASASSAETSNPSLLLWGGVDAEGAPFLEPVFAVDAPPVLPDSAGEYRIAGRSAEGAQLFSVSFAMHELPHGDGESSFVFVLPLRPGWEALASVTLSGPGGRATLDGDSDMPMAVLRDPVTGQVRAILRDPARSAQVAADTAGVGTGRRLDVLFSRGVPYVVTRRR